MRQKDQDFKVMLSYILSLSYRKPSFKHINNGVVVEREREVGREKREEGSTNLVSGDVCLKLEY